MGGVKMVLVWVLSKSHYQYNTEKPVKTRVLEGFGGGFTAGLGGGRSIQLSYENMFAVKLC